MKRLALLAALSLFGCQQLYDAAVPRAEAQRDGRKYGQARTRGALGSATSVTPFTNTKSTQFDGSADEVACGDHAGLDGATRATFAVKFRRDATFSSAYETVFSKFNWVDQNQFEIAKSAGGVGTMQVYIPATVNSEAEFARTPAGTFTKDAWECLVVAYNGGGAANADRLKLYNRLGEVPFLTYGGTIPAQMTSGDTSEIRIGDYSGGSSNFGPGNIDEIIVWAGATATEADALAYCAGQTTAASIGDLGAPLHWFRMGDNAGDGDSAIVNEGSAAQNCTTLTSIGAADMVEEVETHPTFKSVELDGLLEYIDMPVGTGNALASATSFVFSAWINADVWENNDGVFGWGTNADGEFFRIKAGPASTGQVYIFEQSFPAVQVEWQGPTGCITNNSWTHLFVVYDGGEAAAADRLKVWCNDVQQTPTYSGTFPTSLSTPSNPEARIGNGVDNTFHTLNGHIDDVAFWINDASAPSSTQVYNLGVPRDETDTEQSTPHTYITFEGQWPISTFPNTGTDSGNDGTPTNMDSSNHDGDTISNTPES